MEKRLTEVKNKDANGRGTKSITGKGLTSGAVKGGLGQTRKKNTGTKPSTSKGLISGAVRGVGAKAISEGAKEMKASTQKKTSTSSMPKKVTKAKRY